MNGRARKTIGLVLIFSFIFTMCLNSPLGAGFGTQASAAGDKTIITAKFEAEKAALSGGAYVAVNRKGYSGNGYVFYPFKKTGAAATFSVNTAGAGERTITVRYSNGNRYDKQLSLYINGKKVKTESFPVTGSWTTWKTREFKTVLKSGRNSITYKTDDSDTGSINLDRMEIKEIKEIKSPVVKPVQDDIVFPAKKGVVNIDERVEYQTIDGFGGFGMKMPWFLNDPAGTYYDDEYISRIVDDLGLTISRTDINDDFEPVNDNNDPNKLDLSKYNTQGYLAKVIPGWKALKKKAPATKFIASCWSPPAWMKTNNSARNGGKLKYEYYEEFAELCVAFVKVMKRECDIDMYGIGLQNEPAFEEPYGSCVYDPAELAELIKVVGKRFDKEGIKAKIFGPEDVEMFERIRGYAYAISDDPESLEQLDIMAIHGYGNDGITKNSTGTSTWERTYELAHEELGKPLWMTETSGYEESWKGAFDLAGAMYSALKYGRINAWVWWALSEDRYSEFVLMNYGQPSFKYYVSKNYFRYIRPGAVHVQTTSEDPDILAVAFKHKTDKTLTIILINKGSTEKTIDIGITGRGIPKTFNAYRTSETEQCVDAGTVMADLVTLPANSITTLYNK